MAETMTASQAQEPAQPRVPAQVREPAQPRAPARKTFESLNPATGQPIATFPIYQREDADVAVSRA
jgi:acyl-CoA reductase-like NAD-dependent aldehyde dehydrogenase